jgi:hypothetical protein
LVLVDGPLQAYLQRLAPSSPAPTLPLLLLVWFSGWSWLLLIFPLLHIPLLFPNGQPPTPRWRWVRVVAIAWAALFVLIVTFLQPFSASTTPEFMLDNPIGVLTQDTVQSLISVWITGLMTLVVLCVAALFVRYRRANDIERKQIKWLLYACAVFLVVYIGGDVMGLTDSTGFASDLFNLFFGLSLLTFPLAIGIAILHHRLYDIDILIRRTLIYGTLTAILAAIYVGSVIVLQQILSPLIGGSDQFTIVASTLAIAALFQPLRRRVQRIIDRRFFRRKYDAQKTLQAFSARLRDEVELDQLTGDVVQVVHETLQPAHVHLWLREPERSAGSPAYSPTATSIL